MVRAGEGASVEDDGADGPRSSGIFDTHESAARFFLDGHFWNDGNAHSGSHHAEKAAELATFENNLRVQAGAIACGDGVVAEAVAVAQQKKRLGAKIFERNRSAF